MTSDALTDAAGRALAAPSMDMEPSTAAALDAKLARPKGQTHAILSQAVVCERIQAVVASLAAGAHVHSVVRISGGASKEQFVFQVSGGSALEGKYILRMDALGALIEVDREREFAAVAALAKTLAVPRVVWSDSGEWFGQPACIMQFCEGVTKPPEGSTGREVTGMGTVLGADWRARLAPQFVANMAAIHGFDWRSARLAAFAAPIDDPYQAARWQLNWWSRVWREDASAPVTTMALAERWMRSHLPACTEPVFLHGDYRTGNFLFSPESGKITATLDWELAHIGDYHEDLAWLLQRSLGSQDDGEFYYSGILSAADWISQYEHVTGRTVDRDTLHFYRILSIYKSICIALATCPALAQSGHSHQDTLLTWISAYGHIGHAELCAALEGERVI